METSAERVCSYCVRAIEKNIFSQIAIERNAEVCQCSGANFKYAMEKEKEKE